MEKKRIIHQSYALVFKDDALLFVRNEGEDTFHLPFVDAGKTAYRRALKKRLYADYGLEGEIIRRLPEIVDYSGAYGLLQRAYVYQAELPEKVVGYEYLFLNEGDPRLEEIDLGSRRISNRAFLYAPLYQNRPRTVPLLPPEDEKAYWEIRCLKHFRGKIPSAEIQEFEGLVYSASSMRRINSAFVGLCNVYQVNPKTFLAYLEYREKRRKALQ